MTFRALLHLVAAAAFLIGIAVSPAAAESCEDTSGTWQVTHLNGSSANDIHSMTITQTGCRISGSFTGISGVRHTIDGVVGRNKRMTVTRTDTAGCVTEMYGDLFVANSGTLWFTINNTQGVCGLPSGYSEIRQFTSLGGRSYREREVHEPRTGQDGGGRRPAGEPSDASRQADKVAALESRRGLEQAAAARDRGDVTAAERGAQHAQAAARSAPGNAEAQANARDARAAADRARAQQEPREVRGSNREPGGGGGGGGQGGGGNGSSGGGNSDGCKSCGNGPR